MKNLFLFFFIAAFSTFHANALDKDAKIVTDLLEKNGWELSDSKMNFIAPVPNLVSIHFFDKMAKSPSCGLLINRENKLSFIEILAPDPDDQYPHCASIKDATSFKFADRLYILFVYTEKDSRDELYDRFFFIYQEKNGRYLVDNQLNKSNFPIQFTQKNSKRVGVHGTWHMATAEDGIRLAKSTLVRNLVPNMNFLDRDFISDRENSFSVFQDDKQQKCLFVIENHGISTKFSSDLFTEEGKCNKFLASSKTKKSEKIYYLGIFESADRARNIAVFSVTQDGSINDERKLALSIRNSGKSNDMKNAKAYLHEITR